MHIRRDRVRRAALCDGRLGDREIKTAATVSDVKDDAALLRGQSGRQQLAVLHDIGTHAQIVRCAGKTVRQHVARTQRVENLRHQRFVGHAADMAHDLARRARAFARENGAVQRFQPVLCNHVLTHAYFHAKHDVCILGHRAGGSVDLRVVDIKQLWHRKSRQPCHRNMHKSELPRARRGHHKSTIRSEVVRSRVAG